MIHKCVWIFAGVCGSGKTSLGQYFARCRERSIVFLEGDSYHSIQNKQKMASGQPLDDQDRIPWLQSLKTAAADSLQDHDEVVIACSALKRSYRDIFRQLNSDTVQVRFVLLNGSFSVLRARLESRSDHFMDPGLLSSQLETLELPTSNQEMDLKVISVDDHSLESLYSLIQSWSFENAPNEACCILD